MQRLFQGIYLPNNELYLGIFKLILFNADTVSFENRDKKSFLKRHWTPIGLYYSKEKVLSPFLHMSGLL